MQSKKKGLKKCVDCPALINSNKTDRCKPCLSDYHDKYQNENDRKRRSEMKANDPLRQKSIELAKTFIKSKVDEGFTLDELTHSKYSYVNPKTIIMVGYSNSKGKPYPKDQIRIIKIDGIACVWVWKIEDIYKMITQKTIL